MESKYKIGDWVYAIVRKKLNNMQVKGVILRKGDYHYVVVFSFDEENEFIVKQDNLISEDDLQSFVNSLKE